MVTQIIEGISLAIYNAFGDEVEIYKDNVTQGLQEPCFFISILKPDVTKMIGKRSIRNNPFDIHYFPKANETLEVAEKLIDALEFIELLNGDILHATGVSYEVIDNVLHFFVSYNMPVVKITDKTYMESLQTDINRGD